MKEVEEMAMLFERPARLAKITGATFVVRLTADAAQSVAGALRALDARQEVLTPLQMKSFLRETLERNGIFVIIKLWLLIRVMRWAASSHTETKSHAR